MLLKIHIALKRVYQKFNGSRHELLHINYGRRQGCRWHGLTRHQCIHGDRVIIFYIYKCDIVLGINMSVRTPCKGRAHFSAGAKSVIFSWNFFFINKVKSSSHYACKTSWTFDFIFSVKFRRPGNCYEHFNPNQGFIVYIIYRFTIVFGEIYENKLPYLGWEGGDELSLFTKMLI